jgi:hypothetical protein
MRIKRSLVILLFLLPGFASQSQNTGNETGEEWDIPENIHLGVKVGLNVSTLISTELNHPILKPSMVVGLALGIVKRNKFFWQLELNGSFRGARYSYDSAASLNRLSLFYLDMPLVFHLAVDKKKKYWPFIGFQPSLILRKDAYKSDELVAQPVSVNIFDYDYGYIGGLLYKIDKNFGLQLMLYYGALNINKRLTLPFYPYLGRGEPMYNRSIQFSLVF